MFMGSTIVGMGFGCCLGGRFAWRGRRRIHPFLHFHMRVIFISMRMAFALGGGEGLHAEAMAKDEVSAQEARDAKEGEARKQEGARKPAPGPTFVPFAPGKEGQTKKHDPGRQGPVPMEGHGRMAWRIVSHRLVASPAREKGRK